MKRRSKEDLVAGAFHDVQTLINKFARRGVAGDVAGRALLIGAGIAAYDARFDEEDFVDNAVEAFAVATAIRKRKNTVVEPVHEPGSTGVMN